MASTPSVSSPYEGKPTPYTAPGMPPLNNEGKQTSFFEFWPSWLMYLPVVVQSLLLSLRYRSLTLPLIANPKLPLSGMVGVEKSHLFSQAKDDCQQLILDWFVYTKTAAAIEQQADALEQQIHDWGEQYPVVCKPDIGCRGSGVKLLRNRQQLLDALLSYAEGAGIMIQKLASWEPEAGVFYVRHPEQTQGKIISMALKYSPYVVGDGKSTLQELIAADSRAGELQHLYSERHREQLNNILDAGEPYRLVFSASHCRGAIFRDANQHITAALTQRIDEIMQDLPEFYYGRLDIKFKDLDSFKAGEQFEIVEINSASSESLHIWDRNTSFFEAMRSLLFQYRTLFKLGAANRARGYQTPRLKALLDAWKKERQLTLSYPETD